MPQFSRTRSLLRCRIPSRHGTPRPSTMPCFACMMSRAIETLPRGDNSSSMTSGAFSTRSWRTTVTGPRPPNFLPGVSQGCGKPSLIPATLTRAGHGFRSSTLCFSSPPTSSNGSTTGRSPWCTPGCSSGPTSQSSSTRTMCKSICSPRRSRARARQPGASAPIGGLRAPSQRSGVGASPMPAEGPRLLLWPPQPRPPRPPRPPLDQ
mmetsp:Transcript_38211/g.119273  ORF Transcript_38211/g.119273 Transcript_38211/m.119273 type:complete len:207 (+) Transcript_38211:220-840(+)